MWILLAAVVMCGVAGCEWQIVVGEPQPDLVQQIADAVAVLLQQVIG